MISLNNQNQMYDVEIQMQKIKRVRGFLQFLHGKAPNIMFFIRFLFSLSGQPGIKIKTYAHFDDYTGRFISPFCSMLKHACIGLFRLFFSLFFK